MIPVTPNNLVPPIVSFALAAALTPVVRVLARRWGFIAKPKTDRWHKKPTAMRIRDPGVRPAILAILVRVDLSVNATTLHQSLVR